MDLRKPIAYRMPFDEGIQDKLDCCTRYVHACDPRCAECGTSYYAIFPEDLSSEQIEAESGEMQNNMGKCDAHPSTLP